MKKLKQLVSLALISTLSLSPGTLMLAGDKKKNSDVEEIGNRDINKGNWNMMSIEKEIALGKQLAQDIERQVKLIDDPEINEFVSRVGQNLVRNSDAKVPFTIKVVDSDEINAFALPGGFFYVNSGLITSADEEAELAGVMAHGVFVASDGSIYVGDSEAHRVRVIRHEP